MSVDQDIIGAKSGSGASMFSRDVIHDLAKSGLSERDMYIRPLGASEKATTGASQMAEGFVIPYYRYNGDPLAFYRVKVVNADEVDQGIKYRQPRKAQNHIYFPPAFHSTLISWLKRHPGLRTIVITEGEKKAACACKMGIPAIALGGVDSWRSRTIVLPKDTELYSGQDNKKQIRAKLPASDASIPELITLAQGFGDLIDLITQFKLIPVIIFDSDRLGTVRSEVQRAATMLGYELRYLGIQSNRIKQIVLPEIQNADGTAQQKTGLDDYLMRMGSKPLVELLQFASVDPRAFPKHPNPKGFINTQLEGANTRKDCVQVASIILTELDARGMRLRDKATGAPYYYDGETHKLMPAILLDKHGNTLHESAFGTLLYQLYGLSGNDKRILVSLASQFTGEDPITEVRPKRVLSLITEAEDPNNPHGIAIQISDSSYVAISPNPKKPVELLVNGAKGILFEAGQTTPLDVDRMLDIFDEINKSPKKLEPWWLETMADTNLGKAFLQSPEEAEESDRTGEYPISAAGKRMRSYAALLFYCSPFLQRWRGVQLPIELMIGEAGSGKSSLYAMRLQILTGQPHLRNLPTDLRDWYASITSSGGLHVVDNVHFSDKGTKQRISDELCRLITEPHPTVEQRKLYTNNELIRIPVETTFAFTAIQMPFQNADLIQRSAVFETCALGKAPEGDWLAHKVDERGGREAWMAHMLAFLHRFLKQADQDPEDGGWNVEFRTEHRLAHFEQCLTMAAKILDMPVIEEPTQVEQTGSHSKKAVQVEGRALGLNQAMREIQDNAMQEADWTLSGLKAFAVYWDETGQSKKAFDVNDVTDWAMSSPDYSDNPHLNNSRRLGRYMAAHRAMLGKMANIKIKGKVNNRAVYILGGQ